MLNMGVFSKAKKSGLLRRIGRFSKPAQEDPNELIKLRIAPGKLWVLAAGSSGRAACDSDCQ
jgi:hypothetical protein